jgi:hypothetical protein
VAFEYTLFGNYPCLQPGLQSVYIGHREIALEMGAGIWIKPEKVN